jgi:hypothetical protein
MDANSCASGWLLLLAQLPKSPSSPRVALWRRLRAVGATTMVNGAWVLPETAPHAELLVQLRDEVLRQGGTAFLLSASVSPPEVNEAVIARFRADRGREYDEFAERCTALLDEIGKETRAGKYIFAELEESEQDLDKLARWLGKIRARDFFPDERGEQSAAMLERCRSVVETFSQGVYAAEELRAPAGGAHCDGCPVRLAWAKQPEMNAVRMRVVRRASSIGIWWPMPSMIRTSALR